MSGAELRRWYWLRNELVDFARTLGVTTTGTKTLLTQRLAHALDGGQCLAIPIHADDRVAARGKPVQVPSAPTGHVQHGRSSGHQRREAPDPGRRRLGRLVARQGWHRGTSKTIAACAGSMCAGAYFALEPGFGWTHRDFMRPCD